MDKRIICLCMIAALFGVAVTTAFFATIETVMPTNHDAVQTETPQPLPSEPTSRPRMTPGEPPTYAPPYEWNDA
jgi:hypothetical protein